MGCSTSLFTRMNTRLSLYWYTCLWIGRDLGSLWMHGDYFARDQIRESGVCRWVTHFILRTRCSLGLEVRIVICPYVFLLCSDSMLCPYLIILERASSRHSITIYRITILIGLAINRVAARQCYHRMYHNGYAIRSVPYLESVSVTFMWCNTYFFFYIFFIIFISSLCIYSCLRDPFPVRSIKFAHHYSVYPDICSNTYMPSLCIFIFQSFFACVACPP